MDMQKVQCPYCGETIELLIDPSVEHQRYIEDCEVCCRPINLDITLLHDGQAIVETAREDDA